MRKDITAQRGKPLDADCYKAKEIKPKSGMNDNRAFCCGLIANMTEGYLPKCKECGAFIGNVRPPQYGYTAKIFLIDDIHGAEKPCGFEDKPCGRKCIYYNTCTRNPYRYDQRKE